MEPLVAVTVTEYELAGVKAVVDKVKVDVPEVPGVKGRFAELNDTERPEALGVTEELMATVPVKPILATVTVDVAEFPATKLPGLGVLAGIARSGVTVIERVEVVVIQRKLVGTGAGLSAGGWDA